MQESFNRKQEFKIFVEDARKDKVQTRQESNDRHSQKREGERCAPTLTLGVNKSPSRRIVGNPETDVQINMLGNSLKSRQ